MGRFACFILALMTCAAVRAQNTTFDTRAVMDSILFRNSAIATICCDFREHLVLHGGETREHQGKVYYKSPELFSMRFEDNDDLIVINRHKVYVAHGFFHGTLNARWIGIADKLRCLMLYALQGKCEQLAEENNYSVSLERDGHLYVVTLQTMKKKWMSYDTVVLYYSTSDYKLQRIHLDAYNDDKDDYMLDNIRYDTHLDDSVFDY